MEDPTTAKNKPKQKELLGVLEYLNSNRTTQIKHKKRQTRRAAQYCHEERRVSQCNRTEDTEINSHSKMPVIHGKTARLVHKR